jgi:hypothetical protein
MTHRKLLKKTMYKFAPLGAYKLNSPLISRILISTIILYILNFFINVKVLIFLIVAIITNASMERFRLNTGGWPTDFELSTFSTVLVTLAFGIKWGIVAAIFTKLITSISTGNVIPDHFFMIGTYILAAIITVIFGGSNVFLIGMIVTTINCIIMFTLSKNVLGLPIHQNLSYTISNFIFNFIIFSILGQIVFKVLI